MFFAIDMLGNENDREIQNQKENHVRGSGVIKLNLPLASSIQLAPEVLHG